MANIVSFNEAGTGYVSLPGVNIENFAQVSLKFKTKQDNGLIFYMANDDQTNRLSLALLDGALVMRSFPGGDISSEGPTKLNDGQWHMVSVIDFNEPGFCVINHEFFVVRLLPRRTEAKLVSWSMISMSTH